MAGLITQPCCKCGKPIQPWNGKRGVGDERICPDCIKKIDITNSVIDALALPVAKITFPLG